MIRKYFTPFLVSILLLISFESFTQPVAKDVVKKYALDFMSAYDVTKSNEQATIKPFQIAEVDKTVYTYVVNFEPEGWMLMSADERVEPVLAYSKEGNFSVEGLQELPFYFWFDEYEEQITEIISSDQMQKNERWLQAPVQEKSKIIEPIIKVKWNQDNRWNAYCPEDEAGPGGRAYAGCVAVAMAQNMSVFGFPSVGKGSKTYISDYGALTANFGDTYYHWDLMLPNSANEHVALILYHLGVAVEMQYAGDGSGAFSRDVPAAIKTYFDYSREAKMISRRNYEPDEWSAILANELAQGRAVYYAGNANNNEAGHAFNLDGMDGSGRFHFNWGWSGSYNGYFYLDALNPGSSNNFSSNQEAIINFKPRNDVPQDIILSNTKVLENLEPGALVGAITVVDETPDDVHTFLVEGPENVFGFTIPVPFDVVDNQLITTEELDCDHKDKYEIFVTVTDSLGHQLRKSFFIDVLENDSSAGATSISVNDVAKTSEVIVWSGNSGDLNFTVKNDYRGEFFVELFDITGKKLESRVYNKSSFEYQDNLQPDSHLHTGVYFLTMNFPGRERISRKFIFTSR